MMTSIRVSGQGLSARVLSSAGTFCRALVTVLLLAGLARPALAHEVFPAIADFEVAEGRLTLSIAANAEGLMAGIDLSTVANTDEAPEAATYDSLRALPVAEFEAQVRSFVPDLVARMTLTAGETALVPELTAVSIEDTADPALPRVTTLTLAMPVPEGAQTVEIGWDRAFGGLVLRQNGVDAPYDGLLEGGATSGPIALAGGNALGPWETFAAYIPVGFDHIVPKGLDHIVFVLGLFFLSTRLSPLLWQVSAFTLAHTITLALAALGIVRLPGSIVEPLIALSIVFIAVENIFLRGLSPWRPVVVFGFGLLHGLGFASVLAEFGLPDNAFVPALIGFNVGVELGQLAVIAVAFVCVILAIKVDEGDRAWELDRTIYAVLTVIAAGLTAWTLADPGALGGPIQGEVAWATFLLPLTVLFGLCCASIQFRDLDEAYRRLVAVPASVAIGVIGAGWFIERVFL